MAKKTVRTKQQKQEKLMLINFIRGEECRIAILKNGKLEELFSERASNESHVGNIYKGKITNVESGIQAAFVDFGLEKNGFLHISDVHPQYFTKAKPEEVKERVGRKTPHRQRPPIQQCLHRGQEVICQVIKEGIGSKGPTLTTYISIPGRYLVMMPGMNKLGVSRKIEDEEVRKKMRDIVSQLDLPENIGFIVRTAGVDRTKRDLHRDLNYLKRLWKVVKHRMKSSKAPAELYQESDLVTRTIRDVYNSEISKIIVDDLDVARKARDFLGIVMPRHQYRVEYYDEKIPLFYKYGVEEQIGQMNSRRVDLEGGGFIVIDQTEALVAIDVNSGRYRKQANAEQTALKINLQAADEIVRQMILRDLGGVVVIDFIDMQEESHKREVEKRLRDNLRNDRAKTKVLKINSFGLLALTRQRIGPSFERSLFENCPYCGGLGKVKTLESVSLDVIRLIQLALYNNNVDRIEIYVSPETFEYIHNSRKRILVQMEEDAGKHIKLSVNKNLPVDKVEVKCFDDRDREILLEDLTREIETIEKSSARVEWGKNKGQTVSAFDIEDELGGDL